MTDFEWLKADSCSSGACVEVFWAGRCVNVRDSKLGPASPIQRWELIEWRGLLAAIRDDAIHPGIDFQPSGHVRLGFEHSEHHEPLTFDAAEWHAFEGGVKAGEFDIDRLSSPTADSGVGVGRQAGHGSAAVPGHQAATGAGTAGNLPAPVAASSGPTVASMDVPAGQPASPHPVAPRHPEAGRPGLEDLYEPTSAEVDELALVITDAWEQGIRFGGFSLARYLLAAGYRRWKVWADGELRWGSGPLVEHVPDDSLHGERPVGSGEAGPGFHPRGSGPAEPAERVS